MHSIFEVVTGRGWPIVDYMREQRRLDKLSKGLEAGGLSPADVSATDIERILSRHIAKQALTDEYDKFSSTFFDWPTYEQVFRRQGRNLEGGTALMVSSQEAISSLAFMALSKEVYGAGKACIIDAAPGDDKKQHGNFITASFLEMPFQDASVDLVHSNFAFNTLPDVSPEYGNMSDQRYRLLTEAHRVLKPGGQLIMCEYFADSPDIPPPRNRDELTQQVNRIGSQVDYEFQLAGFVESTIMPHRVPLLEGVLFDPQRNYGKEAKVCPDNYLIFATRA